MQAQDIRKLWTHALKVPPWLGFLAGLVLGALLGAVIAWNDMPGPVGVVLVAAISAAVTWIVALEARKVQIAAATSAKRLEAHQEAFALWYECWRAANEQSKETREQALKKAHDWWLHNCLYLSNEARNDFVRMISRASLFRLHFDMEPSDQRTQKILEDWHFIEATGQKIIEASRSGLSDDVMSRLAPPVPHAGDKQHEPKT